MLEEHFTPDAPLTLRNAWVFPIQNAVARRELLLGGLFFVVPPAGWVLNMGHRMQMVHQFHRRLPIRPAWHNWSGLILHGLAGLLAFLMYGGPGFAVAAIGLILASPLLAFVGSALFICGVYLIPCFMTAYCREFDIREIVDPRRALPRLRSVGPQYRRAWLYVLMSAAASLLGFLFMGVGIFWTTVWNWQVAAFCFCHVFSSSRISNADMLP
jgi:hypothetical protein